MKTKVLNSLIHLGNYQKRRGRTANILFCILQINHLKGLLECISSQKLWYGWYFIGDAHHLIMFYQLCTHNQCTNEKWFLDTRCCSLTDVTTMHNNLLLHLVIVMNKLINSNVMYLSLCMCDFGFLFYPWKRRNTT